MEILLTILILTLVVSLTSVLTRLSPVQIPLPLIQIAAGAVLAQPIFGLHVEFNPELFLLLFIPPLLFAESSKIQPKELIKHSREIISLALVLVLITIFGVGYVIHLLLPNVPLIAAFALAAVLSPTDAVALLGIVGKGRISKNIQEVLEGEALMNDASGLVALKFAVAVTMGTMEFSVHGATIAFFVVALGGIAVGIAVTWLYGKGLLLISRYAHDEPSIQIVLMLLLPFIVYLVAEHFGLSGILAAVAAGLTTSRIGVVHHAPIRLRIKAKSSWSMLEYVFNGMVFLILGLQLPGIISESLIRAENDPLVDTGSLLLDVIWIYLALMVVRLGWLWLMRLYSRKRPGKHPMLFAGYKTRHMLLATFAGGRGAITLAGGAFYPVIAAGWHTFSRALLAGISRYRCDPLFAGLRHYYSAVITGEKCGDFQR